MIKKQKSVSQWKKIAWANFSKYIRLRDCLATTKTPDRGVCFTCNNKFPFKKLQSGHFIPGRHPAYLFDEKQVHAQCYHCNVGLKGNWPEYYKHMVKNFGQPTVEEMINKKKEVKQFKTYELESLNDKFKALIKELSCKSCYGLGWWGFGRPAPMGPMDARSGMPTVSCPECGASANPKTKEEK